MADNDEPMIKTPADFGHFLLEKELGHGGMGGVYLARDKMLDRKVGIKVMLKSLGADPKFVERFQREAQAAARLNHPNIAQIYSFGQEQGMPYIAMELVPGGSLDKEMERNPGTLDVAYVMRVGQQVADALALAAESGLVHGDVKPENVLFDTDGNAKLVDFGLAAMQGDSDEIWGTPFYISPEKVRRQKIDYRADIYSLGGTLYHVLTGVPPFDGPDPTAVVKARFNGPPKLPSEIRPDIPPEVDAIIMRMLELEPSMRYPTYQSLLGDFKRYLAKAGPSKTGKTAGPKLKFKGSKPKLSVPATGGASPEADVPELQPVDSLDAPETKKPMSVGAMVGMVVGGIVLVVLLVVGALLWYVSSTHEAEKQQNTQQIADRQHKARQSIQKTVKQVQEDCAAFHKDVQKGDEAVAKAVRDIKKVLPEELQAAAAGLLSPGQSPLIAEAVAYTNKLLAVEATASNEGQGAGAATNAPAATPAATTASPKDMQAAMAEALKSGKPASPEQVEALAKKILASVKDADGKPLETASQEYAEALEKLKASPEFAMFAQLAAVNPALVSTVVKTVSDPAAIEKAMKELGGKLGVKVEEKPAEPPAEEKKEDEKKEGNDAENPSLPPLPPLQLPPSMNNFHKLWDDVNQYHAADIKFHGNMLKLLDMAREAELLKGQDEATADKLVKLANDLVDAYNHLKGEKWMTDARRKLQGVDARARNFRDDAVKKITLAVERRARAEAERKAAEEKAAAAAAAAERQKALVEEEKQKAQAGFDEIVRDLKRIAWERCTKHLARLKDSMKTREGKDAVEDQIKKVKFMEGVQKHFVKHAGKFVFKNSRGTVLAVVTKVDNAALTIQKAKYVKGKVEPDKEKRVEWDRFYGLKEKEHLGYMDQLITRLIVNGRDRTRIGLLEWSEHMLGAALTLKYLYGEKEGVDKVIPRLVKKAVKEFEPCRKWAVKWFPEIELEEPEE